MKCYIKHCIVFICVQFLSCASILLGSSITACTNRMQDSSHYPFIIHSMLNITQLYTYEQKCIIVSHYDIFIHIYVVYTPDGSISHVWWITYSSRSDSRSVKVLFLIHVILLVRNILTKNHVNHVSRWLLGILSANSMV